MDMVYFEKPIFILLPVFLLLWQILVYFIKKKKQVSGFVDLILNGIGVLGHAIAITVILMNGGKLSDVLILVLLSGAFSLLLSPKPNVTENKKKEDKN